MGTMFEWDEAKRQENLRKHRVDFAIVEGFGTALSSSRMRASATLQRWVAFGPIGDRLFALVFTVRDDDVTRVISLREATKKERKLYAQEI